jgi:hypothetical protein
LAPFLKKNCVLRRFRGMTWRGLCGSNIVIACVYRIRPFSDQAIALIGMKGADRAICEM